MVVADLIFECIRYSIRGQELSAETLKGVPSDMLSVLFNLSKKHDIAHIVGYALHKNNLIDKTDTAYGKFVYQENLAIYRYENINHELHAICDLLEKEQVSHIPLKGSVIRSLYPEPWMRTSCDIDILIHENDIDRALNVLEEQLGCSIEKRSSYDISIFTATNVHLELHYNLAIEEQNEEIKKVLSEVWETSALMDGYLYKREMCDEMYYYYHLAHMSKHFAGHGCGIRSFIDVWLLDNVLKADMQKRLELARRGGLENFMLGVQAVSKVWLEKAPHSDITQEIENFILQSGIYGNEENWVISAQKEKGGKFRYALSRIFLSYEVLKTHYPILVKHKWLYPFCQIRRWFKLLFCGGVHRSVNELKSISALSEDKIKKREKMMSDLGLWK